VNGEIMAEEGTSPKSRYVWDREKLAWVEATETTAAEEMPGKPSIDKRPSELQEEAELEDVKSAISAFEAESYTETMEYKGPFIRLLAVGIDMLILGIFNFVINVAVDLSEGGIGSFLTPIIGIAYFIGFWTLRGQTPGKMAIGAKIVKRDGSDIGFGRSVLRYVGFFIYLAVLSQTVLRAWYVAVIIIVAISLFVGLNREKRGPHDILAGTVVVNSRPRPLEDYEEEEYFEAEEEPGAFEAR
jgi:uncharacterized RDD family membrane protein YckC